VINTRPSPSRIRLARERRGLTKVALAARAKISTRSLFDLEIGAAEPTEETLAAIAAALRFPRAFFFRHEIEALPAEAASFRSLRSMTAGKRDAALAAGAIACEVSEWIDLKYELPKPDVPDLREYDPEGAATTLRSLWGLGERAVANMVHLLESRGVRVFSLAEDRRVDAFSLWRDEQPFVFLNTVKSAEHSRMDAAHELGHLVLHRHGVPWGRNVEADAQAFASAFLMPRASVFAAPRLPGARLDHLVQLKKRWLVSAASLAHRLHSLDLLSDWNYRQLCIQLSKGGRANEPEGIARETSQVLSKIFAHPDESKGGIADELALNRSDIEVLTFGLRPEAKPSPRRGEAVTLERPSPGKLTLVK